MTQKVIKVGTSAAITIPKGVLEQLGLKVGDRVEANADARGFVIRPVNQLSPADAKVMKTATKVIEQYRKDLEILAK